MKSIKFSLLFIYLLCINIANTMQPPKFKLKSSKKKNIIVHTINFPGSFVQESILLNNMRQDFNNPDITESIKTPFSKKTLDNLDLYFKHFLEEDNIKQLNIFLFLSTLKVKELFSLINAADFFNIPDLLAYCALPWANTYRFDTNINKLNEKLSLYFRIDCAQKAPFFLTVCKDLFSKIKVPETTGAGESHTDSVTSVLWVPPHYFFTASYDDSIKIWNEKLCLVKTINDFHTETISTIHYYQVNDQEGYLISTSWDNTINVSYINNDNISDISIFETLTGHTDSVRTSCLSNDGKYLATSSNDHSIKVWNVDNNFIEDHTLPTLDTIARALSFSPDSQFLAAGLEDGNVKIYDATNHFEQKYEIACNGITIRSICFSPDGNFLVAGLNNGHIKIWNSKNNYALLQTIENHGAYVRGLAFSPCGNYLATASADTTIKIWGLEKKGWALLKTLKGHTGPVRSVYFNPDGTQLLSGSNDKNVKKWDLRKFLTLQELFKKITIEQLYLLHKIIKCKKDTEQKFDLTDESSIARHIYDNLPKLVKKCIKDEVELG